MERKKRNNEPRGCGETSAIWWERITKEGDEMREDRVKHAPRGQGETSTRHSEGIPLGRRVK